MSTMYFFVYRNCFIFHLYMKSHLRSFISIRKDLLSDVCKNDVKNVLYLAEACTCTLPILPCFAKGTRISTDCAGAQRVCFMSHTSVVHAHVTLTCLTFCLQEMKEASFTHNNIMILSHALRAVTAVVVVEETLFSAFRVHVHSAWFSSVCLSTDTKIYPGYFPLAS